MSLDNDVTPRSRMIDLPVRGGAMAVLDYGPQDRAVDIVFSHANGFNGQTYRTIVGPLGTSLRLLTVDMRGHGATTLPAEVDGREGWNQFRDDLLALVAAVAQGPVVLAGHSMGGTASLLAAAAAPERVRALALFDPVFIPSNPQNTGIEDSPLVQGALRRRSTFSSKAAAIEAYRGRGAFKSWSEDQLTDYVGAGFRATPTGEVTLACTPQWEASNFRTHNYDPWQALRDSRSPVRVLRAEIASTFRIEGHSGDLSDGGRVVIETILGASHFLPMERPELVRAALQAAAAI